MLDEEQMATLQRRTLQTIFMEKKTSCLALHTLAVYICL